VADQLLALGKGKSCPQCLEVLGQIDTPKGQKKRTGWVRNIHRQIIKSWALRINQISKVADR
jgi:hypothetical protein